MIFRNLFMVIAFAVLSTDMFASEEIKKSNYKNLSLNSKYLKKDVRFSVELPSSFNSSSDKVKYPVIFLNGVHGTVFYDVISANVAHLSSQERIPEFLIVTIDGDTPNIQTNGMWQSREEIEAYGSYSNYVKFLKSELVPYLKEEFRANDHRTVIGVSGSSLFPLTVAAKESGIFQNYLLVASHDMVGMGSSKESSFVEDILETDLHKDSLLTKFYFGIADDDLKGPGKRFMKNIDQIRLLCCDKIKERSKVEVFNNEFHYNVLPKAILNGFSFFYPSIDWSPEYSQFLKGGSDVVEQINRHYEDLSSRYGFKIYPRVERWNSPNSLKRLLRELTKIGRKDEARKVKQYMDTLKKY